MKRRDLKCQLANFVYSRNYKNYHCVLVLGSNINLFRDPSFKKMSLIEAFFMLIAPINERKLNADASVCATVNRN